MNKKYIRPRIDKFSIKPCLLMSISNNSKEMPKQENFDEDNMTIL